MERRDEILRTIESKPGITFRELARELGIGIGDLQYHLQKLEREGKVFSRRVRRRRYLFPKGLEEDAQRLLIAVSTRTRRRILLALLDGPRGQGELSEMLDVSQPTVSYHMAELVKLGLVRGERRGKSVVYTLSYDPDTVMRIIREYRPGLLDELADSMIDLFAGMGGGHD